MFWFSRHGGTGGGERGKKIKEERRPRPSHHNSQEKRRLGSSHYYVPLQEEVITIRWANGPPRPWPRGLCLSPLLCSRVYPIFSSLHSFSAIKLSQHLPVIRLQPSPSPLSLLPLPSSTVPLSPSTKLDRKGPGQKDKNRLSSPSSFAAPPSSHGTP